MNQTEFAVSRFENSNGVISWRVAGWLHGVRIRKNFKTREEAAAEKAALELKAMQAASGLRPVATSLTEEQVRDAEAAFRRLAGNPRPLAFYVDFGLANYREPEKQKLLSEAVTDYVAAKKHELDQDHISLPQYDRIRWELKRLETHFARKAVAEITATALVAFLELGRPGMKTYNNRRGVLSTFFKYAFQRGWIAENPIPKVPHYRIRRKRGMAQTLTVAQAAKLMEHFETVDGGRWVPYFALTLFAGIRPGVPHGEITKLKPEAVNLETGIIHISAEVSKVREPRKITIQPNLAAWLRAYPLDKFPIIVGNFKRRREKFRDEFHLTHDVLRHTFISMFVAKFRSIGEAAIQAGNSESIIRRHYLDLKTPAEADEFFGILPKHAKPIEAEGRLIPLALAS
jgi:site-specific recombinase XerD